MRARSHPPRSRREGGQDHPPVLRTAVATVEESYYVLRDNWSWEGPYRSEERARADLDMLPDRETAFVTKTF